MLAVLTAAVAVVGPWCCAARLPRTRADPTTALTPHR
jgi:hypothetical protein